MTEAKIDPSLSDQGGIRGLRARWVVLGELVCRSALSLGGSDNGLVDMPVLLDAEGDPLLPGATLAGGLRSFLGDVLGGYRAAEQAEVCRLFGGAREDDAGDQSPLIVFDSTGRIPEGLSVEVRDGVALDPGLGTAADGKKFDMDVLPVGTTFPVRFELLVPNGAEAAERDLTAWLATALHGLETGEIALGRRKSRGFGEITAGTWRVARFDLSSSDGWLKWLSSDHENPIADEMTFEDISEAMAAAWPTFDTWQATCGNDRRRRVVVECTLAVHGSLLVRSPGTDVQSPDVFHLQSAGRSVLPGTGLAGALRAQATRIARFVRREAQDGDLWVEEMFGPLEKAQEGSPQKEEAQKNAEKRKSLFASRLRVAERHVEAGVRMRPSRIRIDRFSQGVAKGALFEEEPQYGGNIAVRLELRNPQEEEIGLLLLLLKDLLDGEIPVGGASSVGRGMLRRSEDGGARIVLQDGGERCLSLDSGTHGSDNVPELNAFIRRFHEAPKKEEKRS